MSIRDSFENLAEIEWLEHYYGVDQLCDYNYEIAALETAGLDDPIEYHGYWPHFDDFKDTDWPIAEFVQKINWEEIPF